MFREKKEGKRCKNYSTYYNIVFSVQVTISANPDALTAPGPGYPKHQRNNKLQLVVFMLDQGRIKLFSQGGGPGAPTKISGPPLGIPRPL